jgi:hypothetical protein
MVYRGWFALDGVEIANSTRTAVHLGIVGLRDRRVGDSP